MLKFLLPIVIILSVVGCNNILGTRPVQPPERVTNSRWQPPTIPEQVLTNMENAFLDRNVDNYMRCFSDSTMNEKPFQFIPDAESNFASPQTFSDWSLKDERRVFQEMASSVPKDSLFQLSFDQKNEIVVTGDSAWIDVLYELRIHHTKNNVPQTASGQARFSLWQNSQRNWVIYQWTDLRQDKSACWSDLKAAF